MKKIFLILPLFAGLFLVSCKKNPTIMATEQSNPGSSLFTTETTWGIASFSKNGTDQTANYNNSVILFSPDKSFAISNDAFSVSGRWLLGTLSENTLQLSLNNIDAVFYAPWKDLQDVWKINSYTNTSLDLQSIDNGKILALHKLSR